MCAALQFAVIGKSHTAAGIDSPLWFGVKSRMGGVYTNELSTSVVERMLEAIASQGP